METWLKAENIFLINLLNKYLETVTFLFLSCIHGEWRYALIDEQYLMKIKLIKHHNKINDK